jgi:addiction module RelE/StbE family toxin
MRITYLSLAILDLAEIRAYIAANYPNRAQAVGNKLQNSLNSLAQLPNLGKPGRVFGTRELIIPKVGKSTYVVVYRVVRDEVQILRILVGTRDIEGILEEGFGDDNA